MRRVRPTDRRALDRRCERGFSSGLLSVLALFLLAVGAIAWVSMGIVTRDRWPIRWLEVNGSFERVSAEQLRASLAPVLHSGFFTLDLQQLQSAAARLSWVASVQVHKQWPDTVKVAVQEYVPLAHWNRGRLISDAGVTFEVPEADELQGLPWLEGPPERLDDVLQAWADYNQRLLRQGLEVQRLSLDRRGSWSMELSNGTLLRLGRDQPQQRLERLMQSWQPLLANRQTAPREVDLRYTNGFAVQWPPGSDGQTGAGS